jgi:hypothetical protein
MKCWKIIKQCVGAIRLIGHVLWTIARRYISHFNSKWLIETHVAAHVRKSPIYFTQDVCSVTDNNKDVWDTSDKMPVSYWLPAGRHPHDITDSYRIRQSVRKQVVDECHYYSNKHLNVTSREVLVSFLGLQPAPARAWSVLTFIPLSSWKK